MNIIASILLATTLIVTTMIGQTVKPSQFMTLEKLVSALDFRFGSQQEYWESPIKSLTKTNSLAVYSVIDGYLERKAADNYYSLLQTTNSTHMNEVDFDELTPYDLGIYRDWTKQRHELRLRYPVLYDALSYLCSSFNNSQNWCLSSSKRMFDSSGFQESSKYYKGNILHLSWFTDEEESGSFIDVYGLTSELPYLEDSSKLGYTWMNQIINNLNSKLLWGSADKISGTNTFNNSETLDFDYKSFRDYAVNYWHDYNNEDYIPIDTGKKLAIHPFFICQRYLPLFQSTISYPNYDLTFSVTNMIVLKFYKCDAIGQSSSDIIYSEDYAWFRPPLPNLASAHPESIETNLLSYTINDYVTFMLTNAISQVNSATIFVRGTGDLSYFDATGGAAESGEEDYWLVWTTQYPETGEGVIVFVADSYNQNFEPIPQGEKGLITMSLNFYGYSILVASAAKVCKESQYSIIYPKVKTNDTTFISHNLYLDSASLFQEKHFYDDGAESGYETNTYFNTSTSYTSEKQQNSQMLLDINSDLDFCNLKFNNVKMQIRTTPEEADYVFAQALDELSLTPDWKVNCGMTWISSTWRVKMNNGHTAGPIQVLLNGTWLSSPQTVISSILGSLIIPLPEPYPPEGDGYYFYGRYFPMFMTFRRWGFTNYHFLF